MSQQEIKNTFAKRQSLKMLSMYSNLNLEKSEDNDLEKSNEVTQDDISSINLEKENDIEKSLNTLLEPLMSQVVKEEIIEKSEDVEVLISHDNEDEIINEDVKIEKSENFYLDGVEDSIIKGVDIFNVNGLSSFEKSQAQKILSMYNNIENDIEKAKPEGSLSPDGKKIKKNGEWVANNIFDLESEKRRKEIKRDIKNENKKESKDKFLDKIEKLDNQLSEQEYFRKEEIRINGYVKESTDKKIKKLKEELKSVESEKRRKEIKSSMK